MDEPDPSALDLIHPEARATHSPLDQHDYTWHRESLFWRWKWDHLWGAVSSRLESHGDTPFNVSACVKQHVGVGAGNAVTSYFSAKYAQHCNETKSLHRVTHNIWKIIVFTPQIFMYSHKMNCETVVLSNESLPVSKALTLCLIIVVKCYHSAVF